DADADRQRDDADRPELAHEPGQSVASGEADREEAAETRDDRSGDQELQLLTLFVDCSAIARHHPGEPRDDRNAERREENGLDEAPARSGSSRVVELSQISTAQDVNSPVHECRRRDRERTDDPYDPDPEEAVEREAPPARGEVPR